MTSFAERFADLLEERTGIRLNRNNVLRVGGVLRARAETLGHTSPDAYVDSLAKNVVTSEMQTLVNLVTVGKTSFNRYPEMVSAIANVLMPALHNSLHPARGVHIWSAGCSTGEEPYTLAMTLAEEGWFAKRRIRILATDINTNAVNSARAGRFSHTRLAKLPQKLRRHITIDDHAITISEEIRERVTFDRLNLASDPLPDPGSWHIIICANVLIYFTPAGVTRVLNRFCGAMSSDAVLFLGGAENPATYDPRLTAARFGKSYGFILGTWEGALDAHRIEVPVLPREAVKEHGRDERTPPPMVRRGTVRLNQPVTLARTDTTGASKTPVPHDPLGIEVERLLAAAGNGARDTAIARLGELRDEHPDNPRIGRALAMLLFNEKRFVDACDALEDAIAADPLAFDLYFYSGWIYLALGDIEAARVALRRALFLEPGFTFARYELALTLHRAGEFDEAVREYARAEQVASDPRVNQRLRERSGGSSETFWINDSFIVELCRSNKERAKQKLAPQTSARIAERA